MYMHTLELSRVVGMCVPKYIHIKKIINFPIWSEIHLCMDSVKNLVSAQRIMKFLFFLVLFRKKWFDQRALMRWFY